MEELAAYPGPLAAADGVHVLTQGLPSKAAPVVNDVLSKIGLAPESVNDLTPARFSSVPPRTILVAGTAGLLGCLDRTPALLPAITSLIPTLGIGLPSNVGEGVRLMKAGVQQLVHDEIDLDQLEEFVREAVRTAVATYEVKNDLESAQRRLSKLTDQEFDVFTLLMAGLTNKEIARRLHLGLRTVEGRRHDIMGKTRTKSLAELVRLGVKVAYPWVD